MSVKHCEELFIDRQIENEINRQCAYVINRQGEGVKINHMKLAAIECEESDKGLLDPLEQAAIVHEWFVMGDKLEAQHSRIQELESLLREAEEELQRWKD